MGYLSQRKKQVRTNLVMQFLLIVIAVLSFIGFIGSTLGELINEYRFQMYIVLFLMFIFSLLNKFYLYAILSSILLILNFFVISSSVDILFQERKDADKSLKIAYHKQPDFIADSLNKIFEAGADVVVIVNPKDNNWDFMELLEGMYGFPGNMASLNSFIVSRYPVEMSGIIRLSSTNTAAFASINIDSSVITFIGIDFDDMSRKEIDNALKSIEKFITTRDEPVVIIGDFNTVSWSEQLNTFLDNGYSVKNSLFHSLRNLLYRPSFYVIAYKNLQFYKQTSLQALRNKFRPKILKIGI